MVILSGSFGCQCEDERRSGRTRVVKIHQTVNDCVDPSEFVVHISDVNNRLSGRLLNLKLADMLV